MNIVQQTSAIITNIPSKPISALPSLEKEFKSHVLQKVDISLDTGFDYLQPNEGCPHGIKPHLDLMKKGIMVTTGTERSFFALCFSNPLKCEGLVIVDITPKIKAYVDFNTLLLRISNSRAEYVKLSSFTQDVNVFNERILGIKEKIENADMPKKIQKYYLENLISFGLIYLKTPKAWRESPKEKNFKECRYDKNEEYFLKLQDYARRGNIISTIGDINDLTFLNKRTVSVIDTSNIHDYCMLKFQGTGDFNPRVIWTHQSAVKTLYYSYKHVSLNFQQTMELDSLVKKINDITHIFEKKSSGWRNRNINDAEGVNIFDSVCRSFYSVKTLSALQHYVQNNFLEIPGFDPVRIPRVDDVNKDSIADLNKIPTSEIVETCKHVDVRHFLNRLVECWKVLDASKYLVFSNIEGWKEAFEECFMWTPIFLDSFLLKLKQKGILDQFIQDFGAERLEALKNTDNLL